MQVVHSALQELSKMNKKDAYYMSLAKLAGEQSKDPHTKVGSCVVKNGKVLTLGWNGAPRKIDDSLVPYSCKDRTKPLKEQKYSWIIHSEINSILNYGGSLGDFEGASIYVTVSPCCDCAKALIQAGISEVVYLSEYKDFPMSKYLFDLSGVKYRKLGE